MACPMKTNTPHDRLFKATFCQVRRASELFRAVLPPRLARQLDFSTLTLQAGSFVDDTLAARYSDLLFKIQYAGRGVFLYLLFEHQSRPDPLMPYRLMRYMADIWARYLKDHPTAKRLPVVIPVVLHHGRGGWRVPRRMLKLYDLPADMLDKVQPFVPDFSFILDDLATQSDQEVRLRAVSALSKLVLWSLKNAHLEAGLVDLLPGVNDLMVQVLELPNGVTALAIVWRYILEITETSPERLQECLETELDPRANEALMTAAEQLRREGRAEGRKEGRKQGQRAMLVKQLELRFGPLSDTIKRRVKRATEDQLERWCERVITAQALDQVFEG